MFELIVIAIGAIISALLALAKIAGITALGWFGVLVPLGIALLIVCGVFFLDELDT